MPVCACWERTNARYLTAAEVPDPVDLVVCDASFIPLGTVLPAPLALTRPGAHLVALVKPQFEAGRARVGKGGVVRDPEVRREVCEAVHAWLESLDGWSVLGLEESPVRGPGRQCRIPDRRRPGPDRESGVAARRAWRILFAGAVGSPTLMPSGERGFGDPAQRLLLSLDSDEPSASGEQIVRFGPVQRVEVGLRRLR